MTDGLEGDTFVNYCFICRGKIRDFWEIKKFILDNEEDSQILFDKISLSNLICKERITHEEE